MKGFDGVMRRRDETQEEEDGEVGSNSIPRSTPAGIPRHRGAPVAATTSILNVSFDIDVETQKMIQFFEIMDDSQFSIEKKEALSIIVDRIKNEVSGQTAPIPHGLFGSNSKATIRTEMNDLLLSFIDESERKKSHGDTYLKKWFKANNLKRYFMYRSKEAIVTIAATHFGKRIATTLSYDRLVESLLELVAVNQNNESFEPGSSSDEETSEAGNQTSDRRGRIRVRVTETPAPAPVINEVIKAVMKKSFMKHLKGEAREHCQLGHKLELPIGRDFMSDINEKKKLGGSTKVISLHKVGLVGKKFYPWAKDSIDFVACVLNENESIELWGVEVKSRQAVSTVTTERENMRKLRRKKYEEIDANKASEFFYKRDERFQLLHYAYVYNFKKVVLIVGDNFGKVINATVVNYDNTILESYGMVIETLKKKVLNWAYNPGDDVEDVLIPENIINLCEEMSSVNCKEALYSSVKLWKRMFQDTSILPRPTLQRILPRSHGKWNTGKPGSDTVTKIVDDCNFVPPKEYTNYESKASGRCFSNLTTTILRLYQISTAKKDFEKYYPTIAHFRNASSHRCTHKKLLRIIHRHFKKEVQGLLVTGGSTNNHLAEINNNGTRKRPQRVKYQGRTVRNRLSYVPIKTFQTPGKNKKKIIEEGRGNAHVQHRTEKCSGFPFEVVDQGLKTKDQRHKCFVCQSKTKWMCMKCRFYFCMDYKGTKSRDEGLVYLKEKKEKGGSHEITKIYGKTCFHVAHENACRQILKCKTVEAGNNKENECNQNINAH